MQTLELRQDSAHLSCVRGRGLAEWQNGRPPWPSGAWPHLPGGRQDIGTRTCASTLSRKTVTEGPESRHCQNNILS